MSAAGRTTVTAAATKITDGDPNAPTLVHLHNRGAASIHWAYTDAVTTTTGVELDAGASIDVAMDPGESVYAVATAGSQRVDWARSRRS